MQVGGLFVESLESQGKRRPHASCQRVLLAILLELEGEVSGLWVLFTSYYSSCQSNQCHMLGIVTFSKCQELNILIENLHNSPKFYLS
jgi:hypothetical protein